MGLEIPGARPAVIGPDTRRRLDEYMRFRHWVRNLYTWRLDMNRLADLVRELSPTIHSLRSDLETFGRFLEAASQGDREQ